MQRRPGSRLVSVPAALIAVLALVLSSCTWSSREPGLFNGPTTGPTTGPTPTPAEPSPTPSTRVGLANPVLPTFADRVWRTGDGAGQPIRIAVHAVRRIAGATVLDWSVTPLPITGRPAGTARPGDTNLGLSRFGEGDLNVFLIDPDQRRVYRPLTATEGSALQHCLCTPLWIAQRQLVVGVTTLLQVSFPALPGAVSAIDVDIATVPIVSQVPVTAPGTAPRTVEVDLLGPAPAPTPATSSRTFGLLGQRFAVGLDAVVASRGLTSVQWQIRALTDGRGLDNAVDWPLGGSRRFDYAAPSASGISILAAHGARRSQALGTTTRLRGLDQLECLCTDLRLWVTGLSRAGSSITVATTLPALPSRVGTVDVALPGLAPFRDVRVERQPDADGLLTDIISTEPKTYTYRMNEPPPGWSVADWPSPVPNPRQLDGYTSVVDRLV